MTEPQADRTMVDVLYYIIKDSQGYFFGNGGTVISRVSATQFCSVSDALLGFRRSNYYPGVSVTFSLIKVTRKVVPATVTEHEEVL